MRPLKSSSVNNVLRLMGYQEIMNGQTSVNMHQTVQRADALTFWVLVIAGKS